MPDPSSDPPAPRIASALHSRRRKRFPQLLLSVALVLAYFAAYGVARWRKFVVMQEYYVKEQGLVVRETGPGFDVRGDWRGRLKNCANPVAYVCFTPLCAVEDAVRGSRQSTR